MAKRIALAVTAAFCLALAGANAARAETTDMKAAHSSNANSTATKMAGKHMMRHHRHHHRH